MYYFYILKSKKNGNLYVGYTSNLKRRFNQHNEGQSTYTEKFRPWILIYYESYLSKSDAIYREKQIKHHGKVYTQLKKRIDKSINENKD